jgi:hypothetical protein
MTQIPKQLLNKGFRFIRVAAKDKKPIDTAWTTSNFTENSPELKKHLKNGGNYGVVTGNGLVVVDCDEPELTHLIEERLPETFRVKTGGGGDHFYYRCPMENKLIFELEDKHLGEAQAKGQQVIGANSIHPNGNTYEIVSDAVLAEISEAELKAATSGYFKNGNKPKESQGFEHDDQLEEIKSKLRVSDVLRDYGIDANRSPTMCPLGHDSKGGKCFSFDDQKQVWKCFHCNEHGNVFHLIMKKEGITFPEAKEKAAEMAGVDINEPVSIKPWQPTIENGVLRYSFHNGNILVEVSPHDKHTFALDIKYKDRFVYDTQHIRYKKWSTWHKDRVRGLLQDKERLAKYALDDSHVDSLYLSMGREVERMAAGLIDEESEKFHEKALSEEEAKEALSLLQNEGLLFHIRQQLDKKIVGEDQTKLMLFLICSSMRLKDKLSAMVTGESSSGKSYITKNVLRFLPPENRLDLTRISPKALDHFTQQDWSEMILFVGEGAGAADAIETIKMFTDDVSGGSKVLLAEKNEKTGKIEATIKESKGLPVFITTSAKVVEDHEFMNRLLVMGTDMSPEQTQKIIEKSSEQDSEVEDEDSADEEGVEKIRNAVRLLQPYEVKIPYSSIINKMFLYENVRSRRDHDKFKKIIKASAILHQYQRVVIKTPSGKEYLIAHPNDLRIALEVGMPAFSMTVQSLEKSSKDLWDLILKHKDELLRPEDEENLRDAPAPDYFTMADLMRVTKKKRSTLVNHIKPLEENGLIEFRRFGSCYHHYVVGGLSELSINCQDLSDSYETYRSRLNFYLENGNCQTVNELPTIPPLSNKKKKRMKVPIGGVYISPLADSLTVADKTYDMSLENNCQKGVDSSLTVLTVEERSLLGQWTGEKQ